MSGAYCEECKHWRADNADDLIGLCFRYPPDSRHCRPAVRFDEQACGEFVLPCRTPAALVQQKIAIPDPFGEWAGA